MTNRGRKSSHKPRTRFVAAVCDRRFAGRSTGFRRSQSAATGFMRKLLVCDEAQHAHSDAPNDCRCGDVRIQGGAVLRSTNRDEGGPQGAALTRVEHRSMRPRDPSFARKNNDCIAFPIQFERAFKYFGSALV